MLGVIAIFAILLLVTLGEEISCHKFRTVGQDGVSLCSGHSESKGKNFQTQQDFILLDLLLFNLHFFERGSLNYL